MNKQWVFRLFIILIYLVVIQFRLFQGSVNSFSCHLPMKSDIISVSKKTYDFFCA